MNYSEDDLLPLSALQHLLFCERQCALVHVEQLWSEILFTAEGRIMHERVHEAGRESRGEVRVEFGVPLRSLRLGLTGKADVVEFHLTREEQGKDAVKKWKPFPVEYKRGKPKSDNCDKVQLCAQAMCLEEMMNVEIPCGALFYGKIRRRRDVDFDHALRHETESAAKRLHALFQAAQTPGPVYTPKCKSCSLRHMCLPRTVQKGRSAKQYLSGIIHEP